MSSEHTQERENDTSSRQDTKANRQTADTDLDGVVAVHIERLRGPEHDYREEIGTGDEGDYECEAQSARLLL